MTIASFHIVNSIIVTEVPRRHAQPLFFHTNIALSLLGKSPSSGYNSVSESVKTIRRQRQAIARQMKPVSGLCFALVLLALILAAGSAPISAATSGRAGSTGAAFLQLGMGAKAGSMGEAQTAWADDVYGAYFNPAGIARIDRQEIGFSHNNLYLDIDYNYIGYLLPLPFGGTFGFSGLYVDLGSVERREVEVGGGPSAVLGESHGSDLAFSFSYARPVSRVIDLAASFKVINESLADHSANAVAIDLGAKWRPPVPGLTVGASLANLGSSLKFVRVHDELPITLRMGAGYRSPSRRWGLTGDMVWVKNQDVEGKVGGEVWIWPEHFALRAGANSSNDPGNGLSAGAAFKWNDLTMDYAYVPYGEIGDQNLFSLSYQFGAVRRRPGGGPVIQPPMRRTGSRGEEPPATADRRQDDLGLRPRPEPSLEMAGAFVEPFAFQSGPAEYGWIADGTSEVLRHRWQSDRFLAASRGSAIFVVSGDYWVVGKRLILTAHLTRQNALVASFDLTGDADNPFTAWKQLVSRVNKAIAGYGYAVKVPAEPQQQPAAPAAKPRPLSTREPKLPSRAADPVASPKAKPAAAKTEQKQLLLIAPLKEYPAMAETRRSKEFSALIRQSLERSGWITGADAPYKFEATVSYLDGGDMIVYGRIIDRATGIPLGTIEMQGSAADVSGLASKVSDAVLWKLPR